MLDLAENQASLFVVWSQLSGIGGRPAILAGVAVLAGLGLAAFGVLLHRNRLQAAVADQFRAFSRTGRHSDGAA